MPRRWDDTVDVIVVGSGGAALTTAIVAADGGARVLVLEKAPLVGGTTAVSGGVVWVPCNDHMAEVGIDDTRDDALAYVRRLARDTAPDPSMVDLIVDRGHEMLRELEARTPLRMIAMAKFPDYYNSYPIEGKRAGGRSCEAMPFAARAELGAWADRLATRTSIHGHTARGMVVEDVGQLPRDPAELERREREDIRTKGAALIGALFRGVLDRGVRVEISAPVEALVGDDGRVVGVRASIGGTPCHIEARLGVVLACGGFEWNRELVQAFIGQELHAVTPPVNTGDGHIMAMEAGALLANMQSYWGTGAMLDPTDVHDGRAWPTFDTARWSGGSLIVNAQGRRFVNESAPYNDFPKAFRHFDVSDMAFPNTRAWMIVDEQLRQNATILSLRPGGPVPDFVATAPTIGGLAACLGLDAEQLCATVDEFNRHAADRDDPAFLRPRGMMGASIRPVEHAPFYAVPILPGTLGTNGGPRVNEHSQVMRARGGLVPGLYAAGNAAASPLGWAYPGGGATLLVGMTQGYLAGLHLADRAATRPRDRDADATVTTPNRSAVERSPG